jgi:aquaporin Z
LGGGSAIFVDGYPELGTGFAVVALVFGFSVLIMAYAVGHVSGGHFNPQFFFGLCLGGECLAQSCLF